MLERSGSVRKIKIKVLDEEILKVWFGLDILKMPMSSPKIVLKQFNKFGS